ncbi:MAG: transcriptional regulator FtrA [Rhodospirillales bacterium]|nr:transcriptional regulator FtrA [Rhodospirillales bacterium]
MPYTQIQPLNSKVCVIIYDGLCTFEYGICAEVFGLERPEFEAWYSYSVCAIDDRPLRTTGGLEISAPRNLAALEDAGTILIPGWRSQAEKPPADFLDALVRAHGRGARLLSICSGVFVLAAAGLLAGRRATTHWRYCDALQTAYPEIDVQPDVLYVDEGQILTSAGSAAGLDLCLHLVRRDWGPGIANRVAKRLVIAAHREGGQAQFIDRPVPAQTNSLSFVLEWARAHLDEHIDIERLADRAGMSVRTLSRRFHSATGYSPGVWVQMERLRFARALLEQTGQSIEQVATTAGFSSANALRHQFRQHVGASPQQYRLQFRYADSNAAAKDGRHATPP